MYHRSAVGSPQPLAEHARQLQWYQALPADEALRQAELTIGSDLQLHRPPQYGVIHISQIPYTVTRSEVMQLCGRRAPYIPMNECPVHITIDRTTGRTLDCFVGFQSENDAREVLRRIMKISHGNLRMGSSRLHVTLSNQNALLKAIFPKSKSVDRVIGSPRGGSSRNARSSGGFDGFITDEELTSLVRFANDAERSAFAGRVLQRPYESIISAIAKFPWFAQEVYTVHERNMLFQTLINMIKALVKRLDHGPALGLDSHLINELIQIGLRCPGFNPRMKLRVAEAGRDTTTLQRMSREYLAYFPFETLTWLKPADATALTFCASLIAQGTAKELEHEQNGLANIHGPEWPLPFGRHFFLWKEPKVKQIKFSEAVAYEKNILRDLIMSAYLNRNPSSRQRLLVSGARSNTQSPISRPASAVGPMALGIWSANQARRVSPRPPARPAAFRWNPYRGQDSKAQATSDDDSGSSSTDSPDGGTFLP